VQSHHIDNSGNFGQQSPVFNTNKLQAMFQAAVRAATRPAVQATRSTIKSTSTKSKPVVRLLSTTSTRLSDGPAPPKLFGPGDKPGQIPSDELQATGLERLELLAEMQGLNAFDEEPLDSSRLGTLDDPVKVFSLVRLVLLCYVLHALPLY
jgi:cytochrome c oxidase subunit 5b